MVPPVIATEVEALDEPLTGVLRVAQLVEAGGLCFPASLGLDFFRLQLVQRFCKRSNVFVLQRQLPLDFLQRPLDFQLGLEIFVLFQQLLMNTLHLEMTPPAVRFLL